MELPLMSSVDKLGLGMQKSLVTFHNAFGLMIKHHQPRNGRFYRVIPSGLLVIRNGTVSNMVTAKIYNGSDRAFVICYKPKILSSLIEYLGLYTNGEVKLSLMKYLYFI